MIRLPPWVFRDMAIFEAMLEGEPIAKLATQHEMTPTEVHNLLRRFVRHMYHHFRVARPEIDFSRFQVQSSPYMFIRSKDDWLYYIDIYKRYCLRIQAANSTVKPKEPFLPPQP